MIIEVIGIFYTTITQFRVASRVSYLSQCLYSLSRRRRDSCVTMWSPNQYLNGVPSQHPQQQSLHPGIVGPDDYRHSLANMDQQIPSNPRASRNMAEKQRRDNLNTNISTMATLVPTVAGSSRRLDKISILRLAAAYLRTRYTIGSGTPGFLSKHFKNFDLEQYFVDNLIGNDGFLLVLTSTGKIVYISRQVEQQLGHSQNDLLGQSLYNYIYADDHEELTRNLTPEDERTNGKINNEVANDNNNSNSSEDSTMSNSTDRKIVHEQRRSFKVRMSQRAVSRREHTQYECLHVSGLLRLAESCKKQDSSDRPRHRDNNSTSNDMVFVGIARLLKKRPVTELSLLEANKNEYVTRHLVDGRIIFCDHRISIVAGYMSEEVSGLSAFRFMHKEDVTWTIIGLRQMYVRGEGCGSSCYRLLSKNGDFIYLRTDGYLEYDKNTHTVESFVCINKHVSPEEGMKLIKEMKERFSATTTGAPKAILPYSPDPNYQDSERSNSKGSLEDPIQLEDAITHLVSDLSSPAVSDDCLSPSPLPNTQFLKAAMFSQQLPPVAEQASKLGIKKIDHCISLDGKGKGKGKGGKTPKQQSEDNTISSPDKRTFIAEKRIPELELRESSRIPPLPCQNHSSLDESKGNQNQSIPETISKNVEQNCESNHSNVTDDSFSQDSCSQTESMLRHIGKGIKHKNRKYENTRNITTPATSPMSTPPSTFVLKRTCSEDEDMSQSIPMSKRRLNEVTAYVPAETQQQSSFITHLDSNDNNAFHNLQYDDPTAITSTLQNVESPCSSLHGISSVDYQHVDPTVPLIISTDNDQIADLQDLPEDTLLSPDLDANPELMMKIFDDLRPTIGFEQSLDEVKVQELAANDQVVSEEIRRTHLQLANSMALRESQFSVLERDLDMNAFQAQRESLNQLQEEHNRQKQILKSLQQDHHNIQVNVKHNIGV